MLQRKPSFVNLLWLKLTRRTRVGYPSLCVAVLATLTAAVLALAIQPVVRTHDEHSYLLAADTLLQGRLSNPTPPAWHCLQTFHVVMEPTYASKYPLGSGIIVAMGIALLDNALASSWLSAGLLAAACTWMLGGLLSRRWSIYGGLFIALHPVLQTTWSQSLMQGYTVAIGCALLTGAILRLRRRYSSKMSVVAGVGIATLALTRPFEGLVCTILCGLVLWAQWQRHDLREQISKSFAVARIAVIPVAFALACIGVQNKCVTGNWFQLPYQLHEQQFGVAPLFVFGSPDMENAVARPDLSDTVQQFHAGISLSWYEGRAGWSGWYKGFHELTREAYKLGFPFILLLIPAASVTYRWRILRWFAIASVLQMAASASVCWVFSHYAAPLLPWLLLLSLVAGRHTLHAISRKFKKYSAPAKTTQLVLASALTVQLVAVAYLTYLARRTDSNDWAVARQRILNQLRASGGKHLVLVRYSPHHNVHHEWVYNSASPVHSDVVWARDERPEWTTAAIQHYGTDRSIWRLDVDASSAPTLYPHQVSAFSGRPRIP